MSGTPDRDTWRYERPDPSIWAWNATAGQIVLRPTRAEETPAR